VKSRNHHVSHDPLVRNFTNDRKKCKDRLKKLVAAEEENLSLQNLLDSAY
jgi:hypothetical protein